MNPTFLIILLAAVGVAGDCFIKIAGEGPKYIDVKWFTVGFLLYMLTIPGWFYAMKHIKIATIGATYSLSIILLLAAIGIFYFHEKLTIQELFGIGAAIIALVLLSRFS